MGNPYWHDQFNPHQIDRDEIRQLCFDIFSIIRASSTQQGAGLERDDPDEQPEFTILNLFFSMAEAQLSKRLLRVALLVRTFDDTMSRSEAADAYERHRNNIEDQATFGNVYDGQKKITETIRECSNKIIHAEDVRPVYDSDDNRGDPLASWGMTGILELEGVHGRAPWIIDLDLAAHLESVLELIPFGEEPNKDSVIVFIRASTIGLIFGLTRGAGFASFFNPSTLCNIRSLIFRFPARH